MLRVVFHSEDRRTKLRTLLLGASVLVSACGGMEPSTRDSTVGPATSPVGTEVPTSPLRTISVATLDPGQSAPSGSWQQIENSAFHGSQKMMVVEAVGLGAGAILLGSVADRAAVWVSPDLVAWTREILPGASPGTLALTAAEGRGVLLLAATDPESDGAFVSLWRRVGGAWQAVPLARDAFPDGSVVRSLVWTGLVFVAVGSVKDGDSEGDEGVAAIWTSPDGLAWTRANLQLEEDDASQLFTAAVGPTGVMAGGEVAAAGSWDGLLLASPDGKDWQRVPIDGLSDDQDETVTVVAGSAEGWLLNGRIAPPECRDTGCVTRDERTWTSADGASWRPADGGSNPPSPFGVLGDDVVGVREGDPEQNAMEVYRSRDGVDWHAYGDPLQMPSEMALGQAAVAGGKVLLAGYAWDGPPRVFLFSR